MGIDTAEVRKPTEVCDSYILATDSTDYRRIWLIETPRDSAP